MNGTVFELIDADHAKQVEMKRQARRYATNQRNDALAIWNGEDWQMCCGKLITGGWATIGNMMVNGKLMVSDWIEIFPKQPTLAN